MPYFPEQPMLRASVKPFFIEMPGFNLDSVLQANSLNEGSMRGSFRFAHKFYTHIELTKDAALRLLPDGTKIRQIGIRSQGAYSLNLLLRNVEIPQGGKLFVYNADYSYIIGSFDYRNNSPEKILPLQPVPGESLIIEYSEPANTDFEGNFIIAEVNHDYLGFLRSEPGNDSSQFACMQDVLCGDADEETVRSTVLLIVDGSVACTGSLINNANDDGKPYLLTAVHCLCSPSNFPKEMDYYTEIAGTIIAFFNYNKPVCGTRMRGTEEMSLASARPQVILERNDIALLELNESPPDYYNVYYAGWNVEANGGDAPYSNLHHPRSAVKKHGRSDKKLELTSVPGSAGAYFNSDSHWKVPSWDVGSTDGGSSGSPLFDRNKLIIGSLTAGSSFCDGFSSNGKADYFSALFKGWESNDPANRLKTYLDPENKGFTKYSGLDPNRANPQVRLSNANYNAGDELITATLTSPNSGFVFGNSNLRTFEFAEAFETNASAELLGAWLFVPALDNNNTKSLEISVYSGNTSPETLLYSALFPLQYLDYSSATGFHPEDKNFMVAPTENFMAFDKPVRVKGRFFISYKVNNSDSEMFCVYNTKFGSETRPNTAWLKEETTGWIPADAYSLYSAKTALGIQALIRYQEESGIESLNVLYHSPFHYDRLSRILRLHSENESGRIEIYSVGGQLLEKFHFAPGQTSFVLSPKMKGTIGIVKMKSRFFIHAGKIIY
jgi:hypothetical protein